MGEQVKGTQVWVEVRLHVHTSVGEGGAAEVGSALEQVWEEGVLLW